MLAFPQLAPENQAKALLRRGTARIHKSEVAAAAADFRQVLALEPNNRQAREELKVSGGGGVETPPHVSSDSLLIQLFLLIWYLKMINAPQ